MAFFYVNDLGNNSRVDERYRRYKKDQEPQVLARCGLCLFKFAQSDSIMVFHPMSPHLYPIWEGKYSKEPTGPGGFLEHGFHSACVGLFPGPLFDALGHSKICEATRYQTRWRSLIYTAPAPSFEANRIRRLKKMFSQELMTIIRGRLPLEVCENIGRYCLSDYATRLFRDAWVKRDRFGPRDAAFRVTKSHQVWAQHIEFEGIQYIKSLSTSRRNGSDTKLIEATVGTRVNIYFAKDCWGIREVVMTRDDNTVLAQGENLSWAINRGVALPFWFKLQSDGLKLRDLAITKTKKAGASYRQRFWVALPNHLGDCQLAQPPNYSAEMTELPIRAVDWNLPGCRGYTVLIDMNFIRAIIPNSTRVPSSQLVDAGSKHCGAWVYIPIDEDERVAELWSRKGEFPRDYSFAKYKNLIIRTSKGRSFVLGPDIESRSTRKNICKFTYQGIAVLSSTQPTRMLYITKPSNFWLCVDQAESLEKRRINLSLPNPYKPIAYTGKQFFSSTAELRDVRKIAACQGWRRAVGEIVGLLLTYVDGRQRCIGQIRHDHMDTPLMVTSGKIWFGAEKSEKEPLPEGFWPRARKIKWVGVEKPLPDENREYLEVPLEGSLEWQFHKYWGYYEHAVYHIESNELQDTGDEMEEVLAHETASGELAPREVKTFSVEL